MRRVIGLLLVAFYVSHARADAYVAPLLGLELGRHLQGRDALTSVMMLARLKYELFEDNIKLKFDGEYQHDFVYDLQDNYSEGAEDDYEDRFYLHEAYITFEALNSYVSLGYQKIAWGVADDLRVVDVLNPLDLRDFVLVDIDEYRIALPMINVEGDITDTVNYSFITILQRHSNKYPAQGAEFTDQFYPGVDDKKVGDLEFGLKIGAFIFDSDVEFYAFHGYDDAPVFIDTDQGERVGKFEKYRMYGLSASRPVHNWLIRGEAAFSTDYIVEKLDSTVTDVNRLQALLGLDYRYKDWTMTFQCMDRRFMLWNETLLVKKSDPVVTLSLEKDFLSGRLTMKSAISYVSSNDGGTLSQIKLAYKYNSHLTYTANIDILNGARENYYGNYKDKDRILLSIKNYY